VCVGGGGAYFVKWMKGEMPNAKCPRLTLITQIIPNVRSTKSKKSEMWFYPTTIAGKSTHKSETYFKRIIIQISNAT
jgi:hypothetical protein